MAASAEDPLPFNEVTAAVSALLRASRVDAPDLENLTAQAQVVRDRIPNEPFDITFRLRALIDSAIYTVRRQFPLARECSAATTPLIVIDPTIGFMVWSIAKADLERRGEAHDLALRLVDEFGQTPAGTLFAGSLFGYGDVLTSTQLVSEVPRTGRPEDTGWRVMTLLMIGERQAAADHLVDHLEQHPADVSTFLGPLRGPLILAARGDPPTAARLLRVALAQGRGQFDRSATAGLLSLLDKCAEPELAREVAIELAILLARTALNEETYYAIAALASRNEHQRAAAALAWEGFRATGSHVCADLAVWRLAASGRSREAVDLALSVPWRGDEPRLTDLFQRAAQVATNKEDLVALAARAKELGLTPDKDLAAGDPRGAQFEHLFSALVVQDLKDDHESAAIRKARAFTLRDRRGVAPLALWVDFQLEAGDLDGAMELALELVRAWPQHPAALLRLSLVYAWCELDSEADKIILQAAEHLAEYPEAASHVYRRWGWFDLSAAINACERAITDPRFAAQRDELRAVRQEVARR